MNKKTLRAIASLVGTTIGAGIFAIPYVVARVEFLLGVGHLIVLGLITLLLNLCYGEIILRTPGDHQLTGYAEIYLGRWGKGVATLSMLIAIYGALLAYLIKTGEFLALIFDGNPLIFSLLFSVFCSLLVFFGLRAVSAIEILLVALMIGLIGLIALFGFPFLSIANFHSPLSIFHLPSSILPYGIILFALAGSSVIPEMEEILREKRGSLKKAITWGTLIPLIVYLLFTTTVVGISGPSTSDDAITGLALFLPPWIVVWGAILGVLTMSTSFLTLGFVLREVYFRDFKLPRVLSWFLACFVPLVLFFTGATSFIEVLGMTGAVMGGLTGILIVLMFWRAKKRGEREPAYSVMLPRWMGLTLIAVFALGILYQLVCVNPWG